MSLDDFGKAARTTTFMQSETSSRTDLGDGRIGNIMKLGAR